MGLWAGAAWQHAVARGPHVCRAPGAAATSPAASTWGLNVNARTERYQREDVSAPYTARTTCSRSRGNVAYGIWTANYPQAILEKGHEWYTFGMDYTLPPLTTEELVAMWDAGVENGSYYKADTLDDLAKQTGLDAEKLKAVVARYNELCDKGEDEDFHKNPDFMVKIDENGPFYAAQNYAMFMTVMGGLRTSPNMEVCDENDQPIPGLFNVGAMIGDMYANTYNSAIPGNSYGINCLTFGYLLGTRTGCRQVRVGEEAGESAWRRKAAGRLSETTPESGTARAACRRRATNSLPWPFPSHRRGTAFACCVLHAACGLRWGRAAGRKRGERDGGATHGNRWGGSPGQVPEQGRRFREKRYNAECLGGRVQQCAATPGVKASQDKTTPCRGGRCGAS